MNKLSVDDARTLSKRYQEDVVVILTMKQDNTSYKYRCASYGKNRKCCILGDLIARDVINRAGCTIKRIEDNLYEGIYEEE